jgi:TPR repeat protein
MGLRHNGFRRAVTMLTEKRKSELENKASGMPLAQIKDEYFKAKTVESENLVTRDNPGGKKAEEMMDEEFFWIEKGYQAGDEEMSYRYAELIDPHRFDELSDYLRLPKDGAKAEEIYERLAKGGYLDAIQEMIYRDGTPEERYPWLVLYDKIDGHNRYASMRGACLYWGVNGKVDYEEAFRLLSMGGTSEELAECYLYGRGVAEDKERGFKLLLELRKHVSDYRPEGLYDLALCFENGWGTEKDPDLAFLLYKEYVSKIIGFRNWLHKDWVLNAYEKMRELDPKQRAYERFRLDLSAR